MTNKQDNTFEKMPKKSSKPISLKRLDEKRYKKRK